MLWLKALHLIAMVTWFAGLFYLPRLFVYHAQANDTISLERFKIMERKLYFGICTPGALMTLVFGIGLASTLGAEYFRASHWLHIKLLLVLLMLGYHLYLGLLLKQFKRDDNRHGHVFYRWLNEVPVVFLVAIILLAVFKPGY